MYTVLCMEKVEVERESQLSLWYWNDDNGTFFLEI